MPKLRRVIKLGLKYALKWITILHGVYFMSILNFSLTPEYFEMPGIKQKYTIYYIPCA